MSLAVRLVDELPRRDADFTDTLRLPTLEEWELIRPSLDREERIIYLVERLRLIRATAYGPMDLMRKIRQPQTSLDGLACINPYMILNGASIQEGKALIIDAGDIALLAPYLRHDWLTHGHGTVRNTRTPNPPVHYHFQTTRSLVCRLINQLAGYILVNEWDVGALTHAQLDERIETLIRFGHEHRGLSRDEVLVRVLARAIDQRSDYDEIRRQLMRLNRLNPEAAGPFLIHWIVEERETDHFLLRSIRNFAPESVVNRARELTDDQNLTTRLQSALILDAAGFTEEAQHAIIDALSETRNWTERDVSSCLDAALCLTRNPTDSGRDTVLQLALNAPSIGLGNEQMLLVSLAGRMDLTTCHRLLRGALAFEQLSWGPMKPSKMAYFEIAGLVVEVLKVIDAVPASEDFETLRRVLLLYRYRTVDGTHLDEARRYLDRRILQIEDRLD